MKTLRLLLALLSGFGAGAALPAAPAAKTDARTQVIFFEREKFTDVKDSYAEVSDSILAEIEAHIVSEAKLYVPEGQKLTVTITDIDLAGDIEPSARRDVRLVKEIYPPRISLSFKLTDADGKELKHGTRELTDSTFMQRVMINTNDALRFEKFLIDDWLRSDFQRVK